MSDSLLSSSSQQRFDRVARQMDRLEAHARQWQKDPPTGPPASRSPEQRLPEYPPEIGSRSVYQRKNSGDMHDRWEMWGKCGNLLFHSGSWGKFIKAMRQAAKQPYSVRTQQIATLFAFTPFFLAIILAGIRYVPQMPFLSFWSKITWFIATPIFLGMAGGAVGFTLGLILDAMERQNEAKRPKEPPDTETPPEVDLIDSPEGAKASVWVAVEDLEEDQRVAETVIGEDGAPILLRHTLLKPSHIEMLKKNNVEKIKIEVFKYTPREKLALAS